ncbi:MAG: hypothetical protein ACE5KE_05125 [Methanosarcinales archaeon]
MAFIPEAINLELALSQELLWHYFRIALIWNWHLAKNGFGIISELP